MADPLAKPKPRQMLTPQLLRNRLTAFGPALLAALAVIFFAPGWLVHTARAVAAYDAAAIVLIGAIWTLQMHRDPKRTERRSELDDPGRNVVLLVVLLSVVVGLASAISIFGHGPAAKDPHEKLLTYGLGMTAVVFGWALIHTMFTFRYAHMFYYDDDDDNEADRGLTFPGTKDPNDFDFAYFSFVVGMTFQVSDVQITDPGVRRVVLVHGLISFAYNTAILALGINLVSGLLH